MATTEAGKPGGRRQIRIFIAIFVALSLLLGAGYFLFLRGDYIVLYSDLRPNDASALVTELDRRGVTYRLGEGGTSILVPAGEADRLRVGLAGANLPAHGEVGFELFNESSMGLTDFAQKINYQRALQGELSRTIMGMEGIESARVHLALPERTLFRGARGEPRASVTVIPKHGQALDEARVSGIQRLVASAVADLALDNVIVLDAFGRIVSPVGASPQADLSPELASARNQYEARIRNVMSAAAPGLSFQLQLQVVPIGLAQGNVPGDGRVSAEYRPFNLRIVIVTGASLPAESQARILAALRPAVALDESAGDSVSFRTPLGAQAAEQALSAPAAAPLVAGSSQTEARPGALWSFLAANWAALLALFVIALLLIFGRRRAIAAGEAERADFVRRLRAELARGEGA
jgi:flagellar M-ring protein FliF